MSTPERLRQMIFHMAFTRQGMRLFHLYVQLIDMPVSRLTKGKFIPSANGNIMPIYYLTTTGAKSKLPRSIPVLCIPDGRNLILVASNWGYPRNPGWVYNLRAHPGAQVYKRRVIKDYTARELHGGDRANHWQKALDFYPPYSSYEKRSGRLLPVFLLEPAASRQIDNAEDAGKQKD